MTPYDAAYVTIRCNDPRTHLRLLLGQERPDVSSGYGGWEEIERPGRTTAIHWKGLPARRLALPLLFDNFAEGESIETDIRALERLASPRDGGEPPSVKVSGKGGVVPPFYEGKSWVVDALSWGDALMNLHGNRIRQAVTVTLLEAVAAEVISPAKKRKSKHARKSGGNRKRGAKDKRYVAKAGKWRLGPAAVAIATHFDGEDLMAIAARELGDPGRWREIADLNGIRDPRAVKLGQVLRMP